MSHLSPEAQLKRLIDPSSQLLYTSNGWLFNHTVFGRDVSMISRWLLETGDEYRPTARAVILELARLQGTRRGRLNEEEPGRILNEYKEYAR